MTAYAAKAGCEFVIRLPTQLSPTSCFSGTNSTGPTSRLYRLRPHVAVVCGTRIYHNVSRIRYGTPLAIHLGDTRPDHPPDVLAFSVIVFLVVRSNVAKVPLPGILKTIARDATYYFLVIFTSHLVTAMFFWFASVSTSSKSSLFSPWLAYTLTEQNEATPFHVSDAGARFLLSFTETFPRKTVETRCTPKHFLTSETISGSDPCLRYLPVMITRLLFSLRKANASQGHGWSFGEPTTHTTMRFAERRGGGTTIDAVHLDTFVVAHEETRGQERLGGVKDDTEDVTPSLRRALEDPET